MLSNGQQVLLLLLVDNSRRQQSGQQQMQLLLLLLALVWYRGSAALCPVAAGANSGRLLLLGLAEDVKPEADAAEVLLNGGHGVQALCSCSGFKNPVAGSRLRTAALVRLWLELMPTGWVLQLPVTISGAVVCW
jgi:hypothetical protein